MTKKDVPVVHRLLREYLSQFNLVPAMNQEEVEHWLLPRDNIIDTFLVEVKLQITISSPRNIQFSSGRFLVKPVCWRLPERWKSDGFPEFLHSAFHHYEPPRAPQPKSSIFLLQRAHGHTFAGPDARCSHPGKIGVCLPPQAWWVISSTTLTTPPPSPVFSQKGFDVFNALDLMENKTFLEKLKFGIGDGNLQYYLYNWKCPIMGADKVSLLTCFRCCLVKNMYSEPSL